jgi:hypothetical protein
MRAAATARERVTPGVAVPRVVVLVLVLVVRAAVAQRSAAQ